MTPTPVSIRNEIISATAFLVEIGLADDQNMPYIDSRGVISIVKCSSPIGYGAILRDRLYSDMYAEQVIERAYNIRMLDGALIQLEYEFDGTSLSRHRLAFLPPPDLLEFQNYPEVYLEDNLYVDVVDQRAVSVPLRFDFDDRPGIAVVGEHPRSHLTLGQYSQCRIAVASALTPYLFFELILRSFYNGAMGLVSEALPVSQERFDESIADLEKALVHIGVPCAAPG